MMIRHAGEVTPCPGTDAGWHGLRLAKVALGDAVKRGLHRPGRDAHRLKKEGADAHRDGHGEEQHFHVFTNTRVSVRDQFAAAGLFQLGYPLVQLFAA